jgi:hypothetical protein
VTADTSAGSEHPTKSIHVFWCGALDIVSQCIVSSLPADRIRSELIVDAQQMFTWGHHLDAGTICNADIGTRGSITFVKLEDAAEVLRNATTV